MRENNRNSIEKCRKKLPQFTTMNVIDGQAGLISYFSLIFYSLTIDNILNIIIIIILSTVAISFAFGDNGLIKRAEDAEKYYANDTAYTEGSITNAEAYLDEAIGKYSNVVIDNEAGMEHLSRLTCKNMDALMIVTDATAVGLKTAKRILDLALSLDINIKITALVINRVPEGMKVENIPEGFSAVYYIPFDETINKLTMDGKTLELESNNAAYKAVKELADDLLMRCKER